jgi:hypothetical protein
LHIVLYSVSFRFIADQARNPNNTMASLKKDNFKYIFCEF